MTLKRFGRALQRRFRSCVLNPILHLLCDSRWKIPGVGVERIGSVYGGGWVVPDRLDSSSLVLSFGIGEDITFDAMLIERTGCRVVGFDPTPRSAAWVRSNPQLPAHEVSDIIVPTAGELERESHERWTNLSSDISGARYRPPLRSGI